jgi:hypothetical protein
VTALGPTATSGARSVSLIFPSGMLGSGFPAESVARGVQLGADAIAIDAGSTDSGPYYLGAATAKSPRPAIMRDLRVLVTAARAAAIPLVVGSCGTNGTDAAVEETASLVREIAAEERLSFRLARIYSEQSRDTIAGALAARRVRPLPPSDRLEEAMITGCAHIVGVMGHEPIMAALERGADVVLAGRASDTSLVASVALMHGLPPGPAWHAAKTVECGDQCTTNPHNAGVMVRIDATGFTVSPLDPDSACTPTSVAAHMLYENANPFRLREPSGVLDTSHATYRSIDGRAVRVEGSLFETAAPTIKLEGSGIAGYETLSFVGIVEPLVLTHLSTWIDGAAEMIEQRVRDLLGLAPEDYDISFRCYGHDAILGPLMPGGTAPREVGVMMRVRAPDQVTATAVARTANPVLLHLPLPGMAHMPSFAFATSPAEIERGPSYQFLLNHVVEVRHPAELFRIEFEEVTDV